MKRPAAKVQLDKVMGKNFDIEEIEEETGTEKNEYGEEGGEEEYPKELDPVLEKEVDEETDCQRDRVKSRNIQQAAKDAYSMCGNRKERTKFINAILR